MKSQNKIAFFNILSTVVLRGVSIFTAPVFSRLLGDNSYGIVSVYSTWVSIAAILFTLQTQQTLVNARVDFPQEEQPKYQSSVMSLSGMVFLACSVVVLLFLNPVSSILALDRPMILLLLFQTFGTYCVSFINNKFTYEFKASQNFFISTGTTLVSIAISIVAIQWFPKEINYYGRIIGLAVTYGVLGLALSGYVLVKGRTFYKKKYWAYCLPLALPFVFQTLSDLLLGHSDLIMLQRMENAAVAGQYGLAFNFAGVIYTLFTALNNSWCPFFYDNMKAGRRDVVQRQARNFMELHTVLSIGFMLLATEVYHVFADSSFWKGTALIPLFVASYYMIFMSTFAFNYKLYHKKSNIIAFATTMAAVLNIILNFFFIHLWGMMGAALATVTSHAAQFLFHQAAATRVGEKGEFPFPMRMLMPYLLVFFAAFAFTLLVPGFWFVRWGLGALLGLWELYRLYKRKTIF